MIVKTNAKDNNYMCGIVGILLGSVRNGKCSKLERAFRHLMRLSSSRGKEASGVAVWNGETTRVVKMPISSSTLVRTLEYRQLIKSLWKDDTDDAIEGPVAVIGHARLVTDGDQFETGNNQPVLAEGMFCVHNGIVVNVAALWEAHPQLQRRLSVDTEIFPALLSYYLRQNETMSQAVVRVYGQIKGTASICLWTDDDLPIILASNTGSLFLCHDSSCGYTVFASERYILKQFLAQKELGSVLNKCEIQQVRAGTACLMDRKTLDLHWITLDQAEYSEYRIRPKIRIQRPPWAKQYTGLPSIKRCTKCVLPETIPGITFDDHGVCSYCCSHKPFLSKGPEALIEAVEPLRGAGDKPDCIVGLSGGRDSCYGLHYLKRELGLNPVAFTYDWGMVTDLARRNQARLCGKLGVEHIVISADIRRKRTNIAKNVGAWLQHPDLGMVPLFMAGDKQFYYYANVLMRRMGIDLLVFSENPRFEKTHFKSAFCGVVEGDRRQWNIGLEEKMRIGCYYAQRFIQHPAYLNSSLLDTFWAYLSSYFLKHDYLYLFNYINWDRDEIVGTLRRDYDWETATDTRSTWRIGDGTAAFYNYIYFSLSGFTEFDAFRSNQIREGVLDRTDALLLLEEENRPRWESIEWYLRTIGLDYKDTLLTIDAIPKHYSQVRL